MAQYHQHCTEKLIEFVLKMPKGEGDNNGNNVYRQNVSLFFNSIHGTMNHLLGGDEVWYGRLTGSEIPADIFPIYALNGVDLGNAWEARYANRDVLFGKLRAQCKKWIELLKDKDNEWCTEQITYYDTEGIATNLVRASGLTQVFNHGTHHRGQISSAFSFLNLECPSFDFQTLDQLFLTYKIG